MSDKFKSEEESMTADVEVVRGETPSQLAARVVKEANRRAKTIKQFYDDGKYTDWVYVSPALFTLASTVASLTAELDKIAALAGDALGGGNGTASELVSELCAERERWHALGATTPEAMKLVLELSQQTWQKQNAELERITADLNEYKKRDQTIARALYPYKEEPFTYSPLFFAQEIIRQRVESALIKDKLAMNVAELATSESRNAALLEVIETGEKVRRELNEKLASAESSIEESEGWREFAQRLIVAAREERDALREQVARLRKDLWLVTDNLIAHQKNTGEPLEADDQSVIEDVIRRNPREAIDAAIAEISPKESV